MCDSFATSQQRLLTARLRPTTSDMQVQCQVGAGMVGGMADGGMADGGMADGGAKVDSARSGEK